VSAPVDCEPDTGFSPDQAPDPVHDVVLVLDQTKRVLAPESIVLG
jgi:hypothetical protein